MSRICITAFALIIALSGPGITKTGQISREPRAGQPWVRVAVTCFKSGEQQSGMNKICYYNCLGSQVAINVGSVELCPLTIDR